MVISPFTAAARDNVAQNPAVLVAPMSLKNRVLYTLIYLRRASITNRRTVAALDFGKSSFVCSPLFLSLHSLKTFLGK